MNAEGWGDRGARCCCQPRYRQQRADDNTARRIGHGYPDGLSSDTTFAIGENAGTTHLL